MIIQAELKRKQSEYEGEACAVDKVIELPAQRFQQFSRALLADYDFIAENKNAIRHNGDARHCLLILDADGTDGFLVDPQGYNYARYSAFVPNARSLLTPDMGIDRSYLSPAEPWRDESRDEMLRMTLHVNGKPDYTLVLPADEEYLDAVKAYLDIDVFADAMLCDIRFKVPYIGELMEETMMDRKMVNFIKEQYPPGTRIRLNSMEDPYAPIAPGTEGEVDFVDDIGTIHMKWDNGRTLGIAPGEDSFTVLPPKLTTLKLYMPLTADLYERNEYGDLDDSSTLLEGSELRGYQDQITAALVKNRMPEETERGLMHWYDEADSVDRKVRSAVFTVEKRDRQLWGVAECRVAGELSDTELETLKEYLTGQASDGWGEGFEQREISVDDGGELYVHFWNSDEWSIQTEQELFSPKLADGLPELCFSTLPGTGELICIKRGESGYYPSDWNTNDPAHNREIADYNNERLGVTPAQEKAMKTGSMFGWGVPGADLAYYEQKQKMGGMTLG